MKTVYKNLLPHEQNYSTHKKQTMVVERSIIPIQIFFTLKPDDGVGSDEEVLVAVAVVVVAVELLEFEFFAAKTSNSVLFPARDASQLSGGPLLISKSNPVPVFCHFSII